MYSNKNVLNMKKELLFFLGFGIWLFQSYLDMSQYKSFFGNDVIKELQIISLIVLGTKVILCDYKKLFDNWVLCVVLLLCSYYSASVSSSLWYNSVFSLVIIFLAARDIEFEKICDVTYKLVIIMLVLIVLFSYLGYAYKYVYDDSRNREFLGFAYVSFAPIKWMAFVFPGIYAQIHKHKEAKWWFLLLCMIVNVFFYIKTDTRFPFLITFLYVIMYIVVYKFKILKFDNTKLWKYIGIIGTVSLIIILISISIKYDKNSRVFYFIDKKLFNTRIGLNQVALDRYPPNLWGHNIIMNTSYFNDKPYFYIDSGYLHYMLQYGLIMFGFILCGYFVVYEYALRKRDYVLASWLICMFLYNVMNEFIITPDKCGCIFLVWKVIDERNISSRIKYKLSKNINYLC